jgi:hypothetical protein
MNENAFIERDYENIPPYRARKNKANLIRIKYCVMRIAKRNLKKQSQSLAFGRKSEILSSP